MVKTLFAALTFSLLFCFSASAYIDPGSGGLILQAIMAIFAAMSAFAVYFWNGITGFIKNVLKGKKG
jgi:uncharacterized membrane protein